MCTYCGNSSGKTDSRGNCISCGASFEHPKHGDHRDHFRQGWPQELGYSSKNESVFIGPSAGKCMTGASVVHTVFGNGNSGLGGSVLLVSRDNRAGL